MLVEQARTALDDLLRSLFNDEELRRFLGGLDGGDELLAAIPGRPAPLAQLASEAVAALHRRGMLQPGFFDALAHARRERKTQVDELRRIWYGFPAHPAEARRTNLPPRNHDFLGREAELATLHSLLIAECTVALDQGPAPPGGLIGLGGVGKSALAIEYGYRHLVDFEHICWVNAEGSEITGTLARLAKEPLALCLPEETSAEAAARAVLARLERGGPHLLILDNVSDPESYRHLLPQTREVHVIITTRRTDLRGLRRLTVDVLSEADAFRLLLGDVEVDEDERGAAVELCQALGCLTLAIEVARGLIGRRGRRPSSLLRMVDREGSVPDVLPIFDVSVAHLNIEDPVDHYAVRLLQVGSWFAPVEIPGHLLFDAASRLVNAPVDEEVASEALAQLSNLGLVQWGMWEKRRSPKFHRIVAAYGRKSGGEAATTAMLDALVAVSRPLGPETDPVLKLTPYVDHLRAGASLLGPDASFEHQFVALRLSQNLHARARYRESLVVCNRVLERIGDRTGAANFCHSAGRALLAVGDYSDAITRFERAIDLKKRDTPVLAFSLAGSHHELGRVYLHLRQPERALPYLEEALAIKKACLPPASFSITQTIAAIGSAYIDLGQVEAALLALREAAARAEQDPTNKLGAAKIRHELGRGQLRMGDLARGRESLMSALSAFRDLLDPRHPTIGLTLIELVRVSLAENDLPHALAGFREAESTGWERSANLQRELEEVRTLLDLSARRN